jgi:cytochrome c5
MSNTKKIKKNKGKLKVKPCPFPHAENKPGDIGVAKVKTKKGEETDLYQVVCKVCGASGPISYDKISAIASWDARHLTVVTEEKMEEIRKEMEEYVREHADKAE